MGVYLIPGKISAKLISVHFTFYFLKIDPVVMEDITA